jgi:hypothetical protein
MGFLRSSFKWVTDTGSPWLEVGGETKKKLYFVSEKPIYLGKTETNLPEFLYRFRPPPDFSALG